MSYKKIKNITPVKISNPTYVDLYSPWDLKKIGEIECIRKKDVDKIINVASKAFLDKKKIFTKSR